MRHSRFALIAVALMGISDIAYGQGMLDRMKKRVEDNAKRKVEDRAVQKADKATDKALDGVENAVKCAATDKACAEKAAKEGKKVVTTEDADTPSKAPAGSAQRATRRHRRRAPVTAHGRTTTSCRATACCSPTDFTKDKVGDFPQRLEFVDGVIEVVQWQGTPYLRVSNTGKFYAPLPEVLPDRFTIEWDYVAAAGECWVYPQKEPTGPRYQSAYNGGGGVARSEGNALSPGDESKENKLHHARVMVDKRYTKMYIDDKRVANVPNVDIERGDAVHFYCDGTEANPTMIGNIRIAAGGQAAVRRASARTDAWRRRASCSPRAPT